MLLSFHSRSADGNIRIILEETESVYAGKFQRLINGTVASSVFARLSTTKSAAARTWFASGFIGLYLCYSHPTSQDGFASLSYAHGIEYSDHESPGKQITYFANAPFGRLCTSRHVLTAIFSPHTSACISETACGSHPVFAYSVALFQCFRIVPVLCSLGGGGQTKMY